MKVKVFFTFLVLLVITSSYSFAKNPLITASEATRYVDKTATVCGIVASTKYAFKSNGQPTFLNLDAAYPNHIFTIVIFGEDRSAFGSPEKTYDGKKLCVTGQIKNYKGTPQIIAKNPSQITIVQ